MRLCPVCTGVSDTNFSMAQSLSQNQTLHGYAAYNWNYGHFVIFCLILAKMWLPWQRPLDPCNQKCFLWIGGRRKPLVISNYILVVSRRNAFISIYSNFIPKIGCHGNAPLSLVYRGVTDEFHDSTNPISRPNSAWTCCIQLKLWPFLCFFAKIWLPWQRPLDPCNQKCLLWVGRPRKPTAINNHILVISVEMHLYAFIAFLSKNWLPW